MTIETKYTSGDKVFVLADNQVTECVVDLIKVKDFNSNGSNYKECIFYTARTNDNTYSLNRVFSETELFKTKDDLLKSL